MPGSGRGQNISVRTTKTNKKVWLSCAVEWYTTLNSRIKQLYTTEHTGRERPGSPGTAGKLSFKRKEQGRTGALHAQFPRQKSPPAVGAAPSCLRRRARSTLTVIGQHLKLTYDGELIHVCKLKRLCPVQVTQKSISSSNSSATGTDFYFSANTVIFLLQKQSKC